MFGPEKLGIAGGVAVFGLIFTIAAFATFRVYDEWEYRLLNLLLVSTLASAWGLGRPSGFRLGSRTSTLFHLAGEPSRSASTEKSSA